MPDDTSNAATAQTPGVATGATRYSTIDDVSTRVAEDCLNQLTQPIPPGQVAEKIIQEVAGCIRTENIFREKGEKWKIPFTLSPAQIAIILKRLHHAVYIVDDISIPKNGMVAIYIDAGENEGVYSGNMLDIKSTIRQYYRSISSNDINEVLQILQEDRSICVSRTVDPHLVPLNNGIFNTANKALLPFSPKWIFTAKSRVDYNPNASNVIIHNNRDNTNWDVESWMLEIAGGDDGIALLLWQILGALLRPNVPWNKSAWFYSESGNNGKGTLCALYRNAVGKGSCVSIPLEDFGKEFMLEPLLGALAIIVDENDVGTFIDKARNIKSIVTGDVISINRKYRTPVDFRFRGFMVQCVNELPRFKDRTSSFYRRQIIIPFSRTFTGMERKYIKEDYIKRKEVLEYCVHKVLNMDYDELIVPKACVDALEQFREFNNPIQQFATEIIPQCVWNLLPYSFLYDLYKAWFIKNNPGGTIQGKISFIKDLMVDIRRRVVPGWIVLGDGRRKIWTGNKMDDPEPLIAEYDLRDWMEPKYINSKDVNAKCHPVLQDNYAGLLREGCSS